MKVNVSICRVERDEYNASDPSSSFAGSRHGRQWTQLG